MGGDAWSPPFSWQEDVGGRPIPAGIAGDGRMDAGGVFGEFLKGSSSAMEETRSGRDSICMEGVLDDQGADREASAMGVGMQMDEGFPNFQESLMKAAEESVLAGSDYEMHGDHDHVVQHGTSSVFTFGRSAKSQGEAEVSAGVDYCSDTPVMNVNPKGSSRQQLGPGIRKEDGPMPQRKIQDDPSRRAWSKSTMVRLPARELDSGEAIREDRVQLDEEDVRLTSKRFETALVGRCFGRRLNFERLNAELHRRWDGFGSFKLVTVNGDCFICFFDSAEGREAVLLGGPWIIAGQVIGVDHWTPEFSPKSKAGFVTHVWVRFPALPMYCWGAKNLVRIAGKLGEPVYMDAATDKIDRGNYARVCIRMDLSVPLRAGMWIDGPHGSFFQAVEYEGLPRCCFRCGLVGHSSDWCTESNKRTVQSDGKAEVGTAPGVPMEEGITVGEKADDSNDKGDDSAPADEGGAGGNAQVRHDAKVEEAQEGLGPWMLVSYRKKSTRPSGDRRFNQGGKGFEQKGQWNSMKCKAAAGAAEVGASNGGHTKADGTRGKAKVMYPQRSNGQWRTANGNSQRPGSVFSEGQSSKGGPNAIISGSRDSSLHGTIHCNPLFSMGVSSSPGMSQEEKAGKRAIKRKKNSNNDGGDASPVVTQ